MPTDYRHPVPPLPPWFQAPDRAQWTPGYAQFYDAHGGDQGFLQRTAARGRVAHPMPGVPVNDTNPEHPVASYGSDFQTELAKLMMQHGFRMPAGGWPGWPAQPARGGMG